MDIDLMIEETKVRLENLLNIREQLTALGGGRGKSPPGKPQATAAVSEKKKKPGRPKGRRVGKDTDPTEGGKRAARNAELKEKIRRHREADPEAPVSKIVFDLQTSAPTVKRILAELGDE